MFIVIYILISLFCFMEINELVYCMYEWEILGKILQILNLIMNSLRYKFLLELFSFDVLQAGTNCWQNELLITMTSHVFVRWRAVSCSGRKTWRSDWWVCVRGWVDGHGRVEEIVKTLPSAGVLHIAVWRYSISLRLWATPGVWKIQFCTEHFIVFQFNDWPIIRKILLPSTLQVIPMTFLINVSWPWPFEACYAYLFKKLKMVL